MRIKAHFSLVVVFVLVTAIVAVRFTENYSLVYRVILGIIVSVLFLILLALREYIIYMTAYSRDKAPCNITLFGFGAVSWENDESVKATHSPLLYIARFLSNLVIAAIFYGLYATFVNTENLTLAGITQWLTYIFSLFFLLHVIPAFPLDGGAILRLILWKSSGDYYKATRIACMTGWCTGVSVIFLGTLFFIITRQWTISLILVVSGWSIQVAAGDVLRRVKTHITLQNVKAEEVMSLQFPAVPRGMSIRELIREYILIHGWHYVVVLDNGALTGILTLRRIKSIPAKRWNNLTAGDVMLPIGRIKIASMGQSADTLYEEMNRCGLDFIPVVETGSLKGIVSRLALTELAKIRTAFGV